MTRNNAAKKAVRDYAAQHGLTYQQAFERLHGQATPPPGPGIPIGRMIDVGSGDYLVSAQEWQWQPFATERDNNILFDSAATSVWGSVLASIYVADSAPLGSALFVTAIPDLIDYPEIEWLTNTRAEVSTFAMSADNIGFTDAQAAADAIDAFTPRDGTTGVVVIDLALPYPQVTEQSIKDEFEKNWKGTAQERFWVTPNLTDGPTWSEVVYADHPDGTTTSADLDHVLSVPEQVAVDNYVRAIRRLLRRSHADRIVVLMSTEQGTATDNILTLFDPVFFGTRWSAGLRLEYQHAPSMYHSDDDEFFPNLGAFPRPRRHPYWSGSNPKSGRTVLAQFPGDPSPRMLLLMDPPETEDYWEPTYDDIVAAALARQERRR